MTGKRKEIILHSAASAENNAGVKDMADVKDIAGAKSNMPQNRRSGMAVIAVFLASAAISELLKDAYLFGWMVHPRIIGIFGLYFGIWGFPFWVLGAAALALLAFGRKYAAYGITLGNVAGLIAGHFLGELHYAAQMAKITPGMDEGTAGAILCCAQNGVFIWLQVLFVFLAAGLLADWLLRRARKTGADAPGGSGRLA